MALLLGSLAAKSQINTENGSVQVIGYWDKNEKHTYDFLNEKSKIKGKDTIVTESISYKIDIVVLDSTATNYTVQWKYHDIKAITENKSAKKLALMNEGLVIKFRTDELGAFSELLNWEDIKKHNEKATKLLEKESDATLRQALMAVIKEKYSTREAIEAHSLKEVAHFYTFHGLGLEKGEVIENDVDEENAITKTIMKTHVKIELFDVNIEDADYIIKFWQTYDRNAIMTVVTEMLGDISGKDTKKLNDIISNAVLTDYHVSQIHDSGWPVSSYYERVVRINDTENLETRYVSLVE